MSCDITETKLEKVVETKMAMGKEVLELIEGVQVEANEAVGRENRNQQDKQFWESPDFTITKSISQHGNKHADKPRFGSTNQIVLSDITCTGITLDQLTNDFFFSKYFNRVHSGQIQIGNGDSEIDKTLERLVKSMFPKEECEAALRIKFEVQKNKREKMEIESEKSIWIEVECKIVLESVLNAQPIYKWLAETKFEKAKESNVAAVRLFKLNRFLDASQKFKLTLTLITYILEEHKSKPLDPNTFSQAEEMRLTCFSNLAACQFQWENYNYVIELTSKVLDSQKDNVKLLYRRGVAHMAMKDLDLAKVDLVEAHRLDPSNKAINDKLGQLRIMEKRQKNEMANNLKKMFG